MTFDPIITSIGSVIALAFGAYLKKNPTFSNKLIPWVTLIISFLTQLVSAANAEAFSFSKLAGAAVNVSTLILAVAQAFTVTGAHSFVKNAVLKK